MHVDDGGHDASFGEPVEHMVDERPPSKRYERLGMRKVRRALATTRGKDHCRLSLSHEFRLQIEREEVCPEARRSR